MSLRSWIIVVSGLLAGVSSYCQVNFVPPLRIPISLSANFGELRSDHYHSGVDIKTQGVTGKEVIAADMGYVYYILVSPVGFGKAIFVRHPSGYSTVYGHLDSFAPEIEEYVKIQQYRNKSFAITISPPQDRFPVEQGQLLGYSGNTGGSSGPHLHFEVRKSDTEKPVNPEKFNFPIVDNIRPVIERLAVYPLSRSTSINGREEKVFLNVTGGNGHYALQQDLRIRGKAGFGVTSYDYMNNTGNRFGINSIELLIDSIPWFTYEINEFSFDESRYIDAHVDYEELVRNNSDIEKTFILPNDKLSLYRNVVNNGIFDFSDSLTHKILIIVSDGKGNSTSLSFDVKPAITLKAMRPVVTDSTLIPMLYDRDNEFTSHGVKIKIPRGALYDTLYFRYSASAGNDHLLSPLFHIHDRFTPVQKPFTLSLKPDSVPAGKSSKLVIVRVDEKGLISCAGGSFANGYVTSSLTAFGNYAVGIDTVPPSINGNGFASGADLTGRSEIRIRIKDDFSGIKSYTGLIDGNWALFEYDAKSEVIFYKFDPKRITKGTRHTLVITVSDNCNNTATIKKDFTW